jgi:hypothetical protein
MSTDGFLRTEAKARQANDDGICVLLVEAADEIDRLRAVNKELVEALEKIEDGRSVLDPVTIARAVLRNYRLAAALPLANE